MGIPPTLVGFKQRKWDPSSQLSADEQRAELVAAYIDEDVLDPVLLVSPMSRIPTDAEVAEILSPWRPEKLRRIAAAHLASHTESYYILRTHYGGGAADDARLRGWIDDLEGPNFDPPENGGSVSWTTPSCLTLATTGSPFTTRYPSWLLPS